MKGTNDSGSKTNPGLGNQPRHCVAKLLPAPGYSHDPNGWGERLSRHSLGDGQSSQASPANLSR
jgi:hypothetical protein